MGNCVSDDTNEDNKIQPKTFLEEFDLEDFEQTLWDSYCYPSYLYKIVSNAYRNEVKFHSVENERILKFTIFFEKSHILWFYNNFKNPGDSCLLFSLFDLFLYQNDYYNEIDFTYQFNFLYNELYKLEGYTEEFIKENIKNDVITIEEDGTKIFSNKKHFISTESMKKMCEFYLKQIKKDKAWKIKFCGSYIAKNPLVISANSNTKIFHENNQMVLFFDNVNEKDLFTIFKSYRDYFGIVEIYL